jgi:drug/metabolite transporter (DMT)-like permease
LRLGLLAGLFSYGGLQLYAIAIATGQANLAAPIFATNGLVIAAGSIWIYKERLSIAQWAAFLCLIGGLVFIRL